MLGSAIGTVGILRQLTVTTGLTSMAVRARSALLKSQRARFFKSAKRAYGYAGTACAPESEMVFIEIELKDTAIGKTV